MKRIGIYLRVSTEEQARIQAEIHPTKIRVGLNAPTLPPTQYKATGTDFNSGKSNFHNFELFFVINSYVMRAGYNGARHPRIGEPLVKVEIYPIQWREPRLDLAELARLRWVEGYSRKQLAEKYGKTTVAIQNYFQELKRIEFRAPGINDSERKRLLWASKN